VVAAVHVKYWLIRENQEPLRLDEGELAVSNGAVPFVVASGPAVTLREADEAFTTGTAAFPPVSEDKVVGIAAQLQMDHCCENLVLPAIPDVMRIRAADPAANALRYLLDRLLQEFVRPGLGSKFAGEQYAQLILVEVLRVALDRRDLPATGWLRLLADATLRPALALIHEHPAHPWRLADLAQAVSMSRSTFAVRFRALSGEPPLTYLHNWRIRLAQAALHDTDATVAALASELGYASESSFSHAFKRTAGVSPLRYRALHRNSDRTSGKT
jgi:AraC-like DNA-binding protein